MSNQINISVETAKDELTISGFPEGIVFTPGIATNLFVVPTPSSKTVEANSGILDYSVDVSPEDNVNIIKGSPSLSINLGTLPNNDLYQKQSSFRYKFSNFVDSNTSNLEYGDIVSLIEDIGFNDWNSSCIKVDTRDVYKGAFNSLYIFISHIDNDLILMSKGYFDLEDEKINQWTSGRTLYIDDENKFHITPSEISSGGWVRAVGTCIPNKENKKRIWFEPDSTFIKVN